MFACLLGFVIRLQLSIERICGAQTPPNRHKLQLRSCLTSLERQRRKRNELTEDSSVDAVLDNAQDKIAPPPARVAVARSHDVAPREDDEVKRRYRRPIAECCHLVLRRI